MYIHVVELGAGCFICAGSGGAVCLLISMNFLDLFWLSDSSYIWSFVLLVCGLACLECECSNVPHVYY